MLILWVKESSKDQEARKEIVIVISERCMQKTLFSWQLKKGIQRIGKKSSLLVSRLLKTKAWHDSPMSSLQHLACIQSL